MLNTGPCHRISIATYFNNLWSTKNVFNRLKSCQNCTSFVLTPKKEIKINMEELKEKLETHMFKPRAYTGTVLSVEKKCKINIYKSGKVVVFTKNDELVDELNEELSSILYEHMKTD